MRKISFVIPCYKSTETIGGVVAEIIETLKTRDEYQYEIILVNDNSPDTTWDTLEKLSEDKRIKSINLAKNFGQHAALMAGFRAAKGDLIVALDDDGQTPANEVFSLIDKLDQGYDVVYARYSAKKHSWFRNFGSKVNDTMARVLIGKPKDLFVSSYFVAKAFVIKEVVRYNNPYPYIIGLVLRSTGNVGNQDVTHRERVIGESSYSMRKLLRLWMNGFTAFSVKPLRMATLTGVLLSICGFIYIFYIIINKIFNPVVPVGWSSSIALLLLVGGIILFMLGIIGEYIGRIYISLNNSPQYVVKENLNMEDIDE